MAHIEKDTLIEDLVRILPRAVRYLREKNIRCLACGEPIWGTLEDAARARGYSDAEIEAIIGELNRLAAE
jgi:methionine synthase II (cobalamin-independent)